MVHCIGFNLLGQLLPNRCLSARVNPGCPQSCRVQQDFIAIMKYPTYTHHKKDTGGPVELEDAVKCEYDPLEVQ